MAIELSDSTISKIVDGLIQRNKDFSKTESERELRNTKELLKNYRLLENHLDVALPEIDDDTPLSRYELSLFSLLGYRARSKEMLVFVNEILNRYREICLQGTPEQHRRYRVIQSLYLDKPAVTRTKLADRFDCDEKTIRRDEKRAITELSVMIFGIDGLNDVSK